MARTSKTYLVRPETQAFPGTEPWAQTGEGIVNAFTGQEVEAKKPTFGENGMLEGNRVSQLAKSKRKVTGKWKAPAALAEGEIPVKVQGFAYCQSLSSKDLTFSFSNVMLFESSATTTEPLWVKSGAVSVVGKTVAELLVEYEIENTKAAGGHVYAIYFVLTTETERSAPTSAGQVGESGLASAGGEKEVPASANWIAGLTMILKLSTITALPGLIEITDSEGNTWIKDGEAANGTEVVQVWRAQLVKALTGGTKIKMKGFAALAKVNINTQPVFKVLEPDVTGTATGTGTVMGLSTSSALRASQGDFVTAAFSTNVKATFTKDGAEAWVADGALSEQEGLSLRGEWNGTPTEGAVSTQEPKFNVEGEWAALVIAYKVLATSGVTTGGKAALTLAGKSALSSVIAVTGKAALIFTGKAAIAAVSSTAAKATITFTAKTPIATISVAAAKAGLTLRAAAETASTATMGASAHLILAATGTPAATITASSAGHLVFAASAQAVKGGEPAVAAGSAHLIFTANATISANATITARTGIVFHSSATAGFIAKASGLAGLSNPSQHAGVSSPSRRSN